MNMYLLMTICKTRTSTNRASFRTFLSPLQHIYMIGIYIRIILILVSDMLFRASNLATVAIGNLLSHATLTGFAHYVENKA